MFGSALLNLIEFL
jgi:hypothetical protein